MENTNLTVKDVVNDVLATLKSIKVSAEDIETIGIPIAKSISGLKLCMDAFNRSEELEKQKQETISEEPPAEDVLDLGEVKMDEQ